MCTIKFSIVLNTFHTDDKNLNANNICEKSEQIFILDDALVSQPAYVSFLDDSPLRHSPGKGT